MQIAIITFWDTKTHLYYLISYYLTNVFFMLGLWIIDLGCYYSFRRNSLRLKNGRIYTTCVLSAYITNNEHLTMSTQFGELLKDLRIGKGLTLRQCSIALGVDPSNWSKVERGINFAPKDEVLNAWAKFFELEGDKRISFFDVAALSKNEIPADLGSNERILQALPVFFRAARGAEMDETKFTQFIDQVRKLHTPDA